MTAFKYLGRVLAVGDDYWLAVAGNLQKARNSLVLMLRLFFREGSDPKVLGHIFEAVVQVVLIFTAYMWVLTPRMEWSLSRFQHRVGGVGVVNILRWWWQWRKQASRRLGSTSQGGIIWSRNILRRNQLWTSVNDLLGGR